MFQMRTLKPSAGESLCVFVVSQTTCVAPVAEKFSYACHGCSFKTYMEHAKTVRFDHRATIAVTSSVNVLVKYV